MSNSQNGNTNGTSLPQGNNSNNSNTTPSNGNTATPTPTNARRAYTQMGHLSLVRLAEAWAVMCVSSEYREHAEQLFAAGERIFSSTGVWLEEATEVAKYGPMERPQDCPEWEREFTVDELRRRSGWTG